MEFTLRKVDDDVSYTAKINGGEIKVYESGLDTMNKYQAVLIFSKYNTNMFSGFGPTVQCAANEAVLCALRFIDHISGLDLAEEEDEDAQVPEEFERPYRPY